MIAKPIYVSYSPHMGFNEIGQEDYVFLIKAALALHKAYEQIHFDSVGDDPAIDIVATSDEPINQEAAAALEQEATIWLYETGRWKFKRVTEA